MRILAVPVLAVTPRIRSKDKFGRQLLPGASGEASNPLDFGVNHDPEQRIDGNNCLALGVKRQ
jgi:hypothetical protein